MKSEVIEADRFKTEGRQSIHRWRMSKMSPIANGAEENVSFASGTESMVRNVNSVNLAAAVHDHISCTKSHELRKLPEVKEGRLSFPLADHMYANCSEKPKNLAMVAAAVSSIPPDIQRGVQEIVFCHMDLFQRQEETIAYFREQLQISEGARETLQKLVDRDEKLKQGQCRNGEQTVKDDTNNFHQDKNDQSNPQPETTPLSPHIVNKDFVTKCCGRSGTSKYLSRSLIRRTIRVPATVKKKTSTPSASKPPPVLPPPVENQISTPTEDKTKATNVMKLPVVPEESIIMNFRKSPKKRGRKPKSRGSSWKDNFLHTNKPYFLPNCYVDTSPLTNAETTIEDTILTVPSWRKQLYSTFYQIEGTEDIDDTVYYKRHRKCETVEMRRIKWDLQRLRDMESNEKLRNNQSKGITESSTRNKTREKISFYPNPNEIVSIEVTDTLPVIAFGQMIPVFQPSEFSLPWPVRDPEEVSGRSKKRRMSSCGQRIT